MLSRRGFLGVFSKATLVVAAARIPFISTAARKVAAKYGWMAITVNGKRHWIPFWN